MREAVRLFAEENVISDAGAPLEAEEKLLAGGKMNIVNPDGSFTDENKDRRLFTVPDASNKIFLNVNERMQEIYAAMHEFFTESRFSVDLERASVLYHGIFGNAINESAKSRQEAFNSFWDYFCLITV